MKNRLFVIFTFVFILAAAFLSGRLLNNEKAYAAEPQYARVTSDNAMLYRTGSGAADYENCYFVLPRDYYVYLDDTTGSSFYKVTYAGFTGYVEIGSVDIVSYTPLLKYASGQKLKINTPDGGNCNLRAFPSKLSQKLIENGIPDETENISFHNYVTVGTDKWYFVEYSGQKGYIYGDYAVITQGIAVNDGAAEPTQKGPGQSDDPGTTPQPLDWATIAILAAVIGIPAIIILVLLFKPRRRRPVTAVARRGTNGTNRVPRYLDEEE